MPEGGKARTKGCGCDKETELPSAILDREDFCNVNNHGRKCTDLCCCFIFLVFLAAWGSCFLVGWHFGEPLSLIYARDYKNRLCGVNEFVNQTRTYYPRLKDDLLEYAVQTLGDLTSLDFEALLQSLDFEILNLTGICVESCPTVYEVVCTPDYLLTSSLPNNSQVASCYGGDVFDPTVGVIMDFLGVSVVDDIVPSELLPFVGMDIPRNAYFYENADMCTSCWNVLLNTTEIFFRCFDIIQTVGVSQEVCTYPDMRGVSEYLSDGVTLNPDYVYADDNQCLTKRVVSTDTVEKPTYDNPLAELMGSTLTTLQSWASDVQNSWWVIVVMGVGGAMLVGFLWIAMLRVCTGFIVWGTIVAFLFLLMGGAAYCWLMTGYFDTTAIATWVAEAAASVGLDALSDNLNSWVNNTNFDSTNVTVTASLGLDVVTDTQTLWRVGAFSITVIFTIVFVLVCVVAKKIMIAIAVIEEASVAIMRMPCLVFFPFFTAVFIMVNGIFLIFSVALLASADGITIGDITEGVTGYFDLNCTNATAFANITVDVSGLTNVDAILNGSAGSLLGDTAEELSCATAESLAEFEDVSVVTFLNWFQLFCFLWNNAVLQGIGVMVVAGAVADWYWTRPSFDKSVTAEDIDKNLQGARSFHGIPEGEFVERKVEGRWDLMLNVDNLPITDDVVVTYDKDNSTHRQALASRGYAADPMTHPEKPGIWVRFNMDHLKEWNTGIRQGIEDQGEDPRAFYSTQNRKAKTCSKAPSKIEVGLKACLEHGRSSHPGFGDKDIHGVPAWRKESLVHYPQVQDVAGYYGPVDVNFGKRITTPDHQRLNNQFVYEMTLTGKLKKGGNGRDFKWPFCASIYRTFRYHLGSICVGGFIIALVQFIRIIMAYIDKQTKAWQNKNKCFAAMFKVIHLCMCLLERCLKYITKNAFIMVAMRGKPFCEACCASFKLLLTNLVQFVIVGIFSKVVVAFGKIFIVMLCCVGAYGIVKIVPDLTDVTSVYYVTNSFIPVTLTGILAFGVASAFLHVYDLAIATILLCFCEDYKYHNVGEASKVSDHDEVYMPSSLRNIVLPPESRRHLPHAMTYEEVRLYSGEVHKTSHPEAIEHHPCTGKKPLKLASVAPMKKQPETRSAAAEKKPESSAGESKAEPAKSETQGNSDII